MATSPNYGWSEPDNTSLVKDGALAMRTLGDAIDTTMATKAVNSNPVINSAFQIWQRGTSTGGNAVYTADRWYAGASAAGRTVSRQVTGDTTNLPNIQYCLRFQRDSGNSAVNGLKLIQNFETINSIPYVGKTVILSFYARKGADFSGASSRINAFLVSGTGTDQNQDSGFTGQATPINQTPTLTTTWQRFSYTATVATTATQLAVRFDYTPVGTAGAADYFEVTGVQVDIGSVALPFQTASGGSIQGELAMCQRYFIRYDSSSDASLDFATGAFLNSSLFRGTLPLQTTMRSAPTAAFSAANLFQLTSSTNITPDSISLNTSSPKQVCISFGIVAASGTAGYAGIMRANSSTAAFINLSAEL
jgi:hypothetical protein